MWEFSPFSRSLLPGEAPRAPVGSWPAWLCCAAAWCFLPGSLLRPGPRRRQGQIPRILSPLALLKTLVWLLFPNYPPLKRCMQVWIRRVAPTLVPCDTGGRCRWHNQISHEARPRVKEEDHALWLHERGKQWVQLTYNMLRCTRKGTETTLWFCWFTFSVQSKGQKLLSLHWPVLLFCFTSVPYFREGCYLAATILDALTVL